MKLLISACLYGQNVRYDGKNSSLQENKLFAKIRSKVKLIPFCPEVEGGLSTPRIPSEIYNLNPVKLHNKNGVDTTKFFLDGAEKTLQLCQENGIKIALLKSKSPSCSNDKIYDGTFTKKMLKQNGVTASLLKKNNIFIFNENQLEELYKYIQKASISSTDQD